MKKIEKCPLIAHATFPGFYIYFSITIKKTTVKSKNVLNKIPTR